MTVGSSAESRSNGRFSQDGAETFLGGSRVPMPDTPVLSLSWASLEHRMSGLKTTNWPLDVSLEVAIRDP